LTPVVENREIVRHRTKQRELQQITVPRAGIERQCQHCRNPSLCEP